MSKTNKELIEAKKLALANIDNVIENSHKIISIAAEAKPFIESAKSVTEIEIITITMFCKLQQIHDSIGE